MASVLWLSGLTFSSVKRADILSYSNQQQEGFALFGSNVACLRLEYNL